MIINNKHIEQLTQTKAEKVERTYFNKDSSKNTYSRPATDTLTLSNAALAKMTGKNIEEITPTYVRPKTASSLLAANQTDPEVTRSQSRDNRFNDMMQSILDKRLGIDRDKLAELEAMIEEIAKNENMSPEEKQKAIEQLDKMKEDLIKESIEMKKVAKQSFQDNGEGDSKREF
jgi:hypothetical protein